MIRYPARRRPRLFEAVFHLAGEPVAEGRWNADKKRRIMDSGRIGTANLVAELKRDQIGSAGPDLYASKKVEFPLGVVIEPLPG